MRTAGLRIAAIITCLWMLFPVYLITLSAFSTQDAVYEYPKPLLPRDLTFATVSEFLNSQGVYAAMVRSVIVAVLTMLLAIAIGAPAGYALARFRFRGSSAVRLGVVSTRAFPIIIIAVPLATWFASRGLLDTTYGVALAHTAIAVPFVVLMTAGAFMGVGPELEEAAMTLGCTRLSAFVRIALPLALPGLAACAIFAFIVSWNEVFASSILTLEHRTLAALVLNSAGTAPLPYRWAGGFILLAPSLIVVFVIRKYLFNLWGKAAG